MCSCKQGFVTFLSFLLFSDFVVLFKGRNECWGNRYLNCAQDMYNKSVSWTFAVCLLSNQGRIPENAQLCERSKTDVKQATEHDF